MASYAAFGGWPTIDVSYCKKGSALRHFDITRIGVNGAIGQCMCLTCQFLHEFFLVSVSIRFHVHSFMWLMRYAVLIMFGVWGW